MSIAWYVNRLTRMGPAEILHRLNEQAKRRLSRRGAQGWATFASSGPLPRLDWMRSGLADRASPMLRAAVREAADAQLAGRFEALGVHWPARPGADLFPPAFWRLDPVTGKLWPGADRYCFDISYRHERELGDIKYVWEANRLQFLQPLAAAYLLFDDTLALGAVDQALASWAEANPPFRGLGWNSGIELALRAVSILFALSLCGEALSASTQALVRPLLAAHLYWLERYPSRFSSANNHRVAELMAAYLLRCALGGADSDAAAKRARKSLAREAEKQILDDGVPAEQSPTYGAFTAEMLLAGQISAMAQSETLGEAADHRLTRFADFVAALAEAHGRVPAIGDDDEGRVFTLCRPEPTYAASVARACAGQTGATSTITADLVPELRDALFPTPVAGQLKSQAIASFPTGGYTVVRDLVAGRKVQLLMDHGPLGYLSIAAHGHADANAILLTIDDQPVLVDAGTYLYHSGAEWRDWFRGTRSHNTLTVGGVNQSRILGPFNWGERAKARRLVLDDLPDWAISAEHDGYQRSYGVRHVRAVTRIQNRIELLDTLVPAPTSAIAIELVFQFAPDCAVTVHNGAVEVSRHGAPLARVWFGVEGQVRVASGEASLEGGWVSPHFGAKVAAPRLSWSGPAPADGLKTSIYIL